MKRSVGSQALVKRKVQVLQGRSDDPRSASGTSRDLEFSCLEVLGDGRRDGGLWSFSGVDVVGRGGRETEGVDGAGSCEDDKSEMGFKKVGRWVYAQLEKSSISLFKTMPSEVMTLEPQNKFTASTRTINAPFNFPTRHGEETTHSW